MPMGERDDALLCKGWEPKYTIPSYKYIARKVYDLECNWKVYVDNYLDGGYHVNTIHPELAANIHYQRYHNELHDRAVLQVAPLGEANRAGADPGGTETTQSLLSIRFSFLAAKWIIRQSL